MAKNLSEKVYQDGILEFRKKNFREMERNLEVAVEIREGRYNKKKVKCPHCKQTFEINWATVKDINEAIKIISRMLGSLVPEKIEPKTRDTLTQKEKELTPSEKAEVDDLLKA